MAIEILENTLLKLLVRRGTNQDRKQIVLETGELGYATDTKRLYIGDGVTPGGILVGNKWAGNHASVTSLAPVVTGDYAYDTDNHEIKICTAGTGAVASDWTTVSNLISAGNKTITINAANQIIVGKLSAGNIDYDALGSSLTLDSNRVALSASISINNIFQRDSSLTSYLSLPSKLKINSIDYTFPTTSPQTDTFLGYNTTDAAGKSQLAWQVPKVVYSAVAPTTAALIPIGTIVPYASAAAGAPYGWLNCNGQYVDAVTYSELLTAIGVGYGRTWSDNTFAVPNLSSTMLYGWTGASSPSESTLVGVTTAHRADPGLSAVGMSYIIKAFGGISNPTLTVRNNLSASVQYRTRTGGASGPSVDKTGVSFNPLSGEILISRPQPGVEIFQSAGGSPTFTMPAGITFVKFYVTGSGSRGSWRSGNAGGTAIGYLHASPGTVFPLEIGAVPTTIGHPSKILDPDGSGNALVTAPGGAHATNTAASPTVATSDYLPTDTILILGGVGNIDTDDGGDEESTGGASYYGTSPAWGGGQGSHAGGAMGPVPSTGAIVFEWN
jgi:microcystin-dependent protein